MTLTKSKVKVYVRTRPTDKFASNHINLPQDNQTISIHSVRDGKGIAVNNQVADWSFRADKIFHNAVQEEVFAEVGTNAIRNLLEGYNGTVMCYGQTGAGKTFTVTGATESFAHRGLIPRAISYLFKEIGERPEFAYNVSVSYLEIYNETLVDLLSPDSAPSQFVIMEDEEGIYVKGLNLYFTVDEEEALNLLFEGETNRAIGEHAMNKQSSRSHCIFTLYVEARPRTKSDANYLTSKLHFVDLAGSERLSKTKSEGRIQQEAMYINKSLLFLEQTVIALSEKSRFIPYRQSKLTHFLKDSLGGSCCTTLIANVWPEAGYLEETISTLRFASRMINVPSEPVIHQHMEPAILVKNLQQEIEKLRTELEMHDTLHNRKKVSYEPLSRQQKAEIRDQVRGYLEGTVDDLEIINVRQVKEVFAAFRDVYGTLEDEIDQKLRSQYVLLDKSDADAVSQAKSSGLLPEDFEVDRVGEVDKAGFGIGLAPKGTKAEKDSAFIQQKKKDSKKKKQINVDAPSPPGTKSPSILDEKPAAGRKHKDTKASDGAQGVSNEAALEDKLKADASDRPSTPPDRAASFEEFKQAEGAEIQKVLLDNKTVLQQKKKEFQLLAHSVNEVKRQIDDHKSVLQRLQREREQQGLAYPAHGQGEMIVTEDEFEQLKLLRLLKLQYREQFDRYKDLRNEIHYCQRLVDQCRQKLVQEFDKWYADNYLGPQGGTASSADAGYGRRRGALPPVGKLQPLADDDGERFDRIQRQLLKEEPDAFPFYMAKKRVDKRKDYDKAMAQAQPALSKKPSWPARNFAQQQPKTLELS